MLAAGAAGGGPVQSEAVHILGIAVPVLESTRVLVQEQPAVNVWASDQNPVPARPVSEGSMAAALVVLPVTVLPMPVQRILQG